MSCTRHWASCTWRPAATGGPDAFGYTWIDSDTAAGPTYSWIEIKGFGEQVIGLGDDNVVGPFDLGFDFPYYGTLFNSINIGIKG